jgi:hypothetical protein
VVPALARLLAQAAEVVREQTGGLGLGGVMVTGLGEDGGLTLTGLLQGAKAVLGGIV